MKGHALCKGMAAAMLGAALMIAGATSPVSAQQPITGDFRLMQLQNFLEDGALVRSTWLELRGDYADWGDGGSDFEVLGIALFQIADRAELGATFGYLDRERSEDQVLFGESLGSDFSNNGPSDINVFGKFQLVGGENPWAAGLLVKLPVADDKELLGSGATDYELFVGNRRTRAKSALIWNAAVRFNGDPEEPGAGSAKTSLAAAGGVILKMSYSWSFLAEARYETNRYDGGDDAFLLMPTFDFRPTENIALRLGVGFGLTDGAPNEDYSFGFVFHY